MSLLAILSRMTQSWRAPSLLRLLRPHQNHLIASENVYVNIKLHSYFSVVPVPHFGEVTQRLATVLHREMACLYIEVLQLLNYPIRPRTSFFNPANNQSEGEPSESRR